MRNNRGFTLVELLVAISILAILTIIAIPTLRAFQQKNQTTQYANYKKSLQTSGKLYNDSYSDDIFGEAPFGCEKVKLKELMNKKVAKDISLKDVSCNISYNNSFVVLRKFGNEYSYKAYLYCEDSGHSVRYDDMSEDFGLCVNADKPPRVDVTYKNADSNKTKDKSVVVTLIDEYGFTANQSFDYAWVQASQVSNLNNITYTDTYNYYNEVKKSTGKEVTIKSKSILPKGGLTGKFFLVIKPRNIQNIVGLVNDEIKVAGPFEYDHTAPACPEITVVDQNGKTVAPGHSAKEIIFKINFKNKEKDFKSFDLEQSLNDGDYKNKGSNAVADTYKPNGDGKYKIKVKPRDYAGNVNNNCVSSVYIKDNQAPNCPTVTAKANKKNFNINSWTDAKSVDFTFKFSSDTTKWDWYTDNSNGTKTIDNVSYKLWDSKLSVSTKTKSISGEGKRRILTAVYDEAGNVNTKCVSKIWGIDRCGHTKSVGGKWSAWSKCSGVCGTGKQTRTKTVTLQSTLNTKKNCGSKTESDSRDCKLSTDCCSSVIYKNGTSCSAACGNGTYNQLAYSKYTDERCPKKDKASGGSACKIKDCPGGVTLVLNVYKRNSAKKKTGSSVGSITVTDGSGTLTGSQIKENVNGYLNKDKYPYGIYFELNANSTAGLKKYTYSWNEVLYKAGSSYKKLNGENSPSTKSLSGTSQTITASISGQGMRYGTFVVEDNSGKKSTIIIDIGLDRAAPTGLEVHAYKKKNNDTVTSSKGLSKFNEDDWYKGWVFTKADSASDKISGVYYYMSASGATETSKNVNIAYRNVNAEGSSKVTYKACDAAGNCSDTKSVSMKLDRSAPEIVSYHAKEKSNWTHFYIKVKDKAGLNTVNKKKKTDGVMYYCYDGSPGGCNNICEKSSYKKVGKSGKYFDTAQIDDNLKDKSVDTIEIKTSNGCAKSSSYKVYILFYACDQLNNCAWRAKDKPYVLKANQRKEKNL